MLEERKNQILKKIFEAESKLEKVNGEKATRISEKQNFDFLKKIDRLENMQRMQDITELKKAKMLDKIRKDYMRTETIMYFFFFLVNLSDFLKRREKGEIIKMKQELRKKLDYERESLLKEFERKKKDNKLDLTKFASTYDVALCKYYYFLLFLLFLKKFKKKLIFSSKTETFLGKTEIGE